MATEGVVGASYDEENIFAKILDGTVPSYKVYESKATIAILDAFPQVDYHTLVIPKAKGATCLLDMKMYQATDVLRDVQRVARAVKAATGCDGIQIRQNNGDAAGQTVFHPHFHILPCFKDDQKFSLSKGRETMMTADEAAPLVDAVKEHLKNTRKVLKNPKFGKVEAIKPSGSGLNLRVKILEDASVVDNYGRTFHEVLAGDASGSVVLSLRPDQVEICKKDATVTVQNGRAIMVNGHIRVAVDKWGKIAESAEQVEEVSSSNNVSGIEYELVQPK